MDVSTIIAQLRADQWKIDAAIRSLEGLSSQPRRSGKKRGRKSMNPSERLIVSARMKSLWASRQQDSTTQCAEPDVAQVVTDRTMDIGAALGA